MANAENEISTRKPFDAAQAHQQVDKFANGHASILSSDDQRLALAFRPTESKLLPSNNQLLEQLRTDA